MKGAQSCPTLCDPMDYTVRGTLQARIPEWVAFPFSSRSSQPRNLLHCRQILYQLSYQFSSVQSLSDVQLCDPMDRSTPGLSITNSRSLLKLTSTESVMPSNHLILRCPLLLLPSIFPALAESMKDVLKDGRREEKGTTEDKMVGRHHQRNGHEFEQALGVADG